MPISMFELESKDDYTVAECISALRDEDFCNVRYANFLNIINSQRHLSNLNKVNVPEGQIISLDYKPCYFSDTGNCYDWTKNKRIEEEPFLNEGVDEEALFRYVYKPNDVLF